MAKGKKPEPLAISCSASDCKNDLHCFRQTTKNQQFSKGTCQQCGADLIDWKRVHVRNLDDADNTFEALKNEFIRHEFFHREFDQKAKNYALRKGRRLLIEAARNRLTKYLAPAEPFRDGT